MKPTVKPELLGEVTCPSGTLLVVDMGLLGLWSHLDPPLMPDWSQDPAIVRLANAALDFRVEGPDAAAATAVFGRSPGWLYDRPAEFAAHFAEAIAARKLDAHLSPLANRVPHLTRVDHVVADRGCGTVEFHGIWAVCVGGLPCDATFPVLGTRNSSGDDLWRHVVLEIAEGNVARTDPVGEVAVDMARLALADVGALAHGEHVSSLDGKADFVFWGRDARKAARRCREPMTSDTEFGWTDLPIDEAIARGTRVEELRADGALLLVTDFRPHSHHYQVMAQIRAAATGSGTIEVGGATVCGFATGWGDGFYPVERHLSDDGRLLRVRILLAAD